MIESVLAAGMVLQLAKAQACVPSPEQGHTGASALTWYINAEPLTFEKKSYVKYGLPRVLGPGEVELVGSWRGGFLYAETGYAGREVLYLLTNLAGCEFQPYQVDG
ncbi:MAG TPA: hypothetical protein VI168_01960 [Croceibacterium sp.]